MVIILIISLAVIVGIFIYIDESRKKERIAAGTYGVSEKPQDNRKTSENYSDVKITVPDNYDYMEIKIAGANYRNNMKDYLGEFDGKLVAEPNNEYDPNAIAIKVGRKKMGYVPAEETDRVREFTGDVLPYDCHGVVAESYDGDGKRYYWGLVIIVKEKAKS